MGKAKRIDQSKGPSPRLSKKKTGSEIVKKSSDVDLTLNVIKTADINALERDTHVIPYTKEEAEGKQVHVFFEKRSNPNAGSLQKGVVRAFDPNYAETNEKAKNVEEEFEKTGRGPEKFERGGVTFSYDSQPQGPHYIVYHDGDENWANLAQEVVIWENGLITGDKSIWKEEATEEEKKAVEEKAKKAGASKPTAEAPKETEAGPSGHKRATREKAKLAETGKKREAPAAATVANPEKPVAEPSVAATGEAPHDAAAAAAPAPAPPSDKEGATAVPEPDQKRQKVEAPIAPKGEDKKQPEEKTAAEPAAEEMAEGPSGGVAPQGQEEQPKEALAAQEKLVEAEKSAPVAAEEQPKEAVGKPEERARAVEAPGPATARVAAASADVEMAEAEKPEPGASRGIKAIAAAAGPSAPVAIVRKGPKETVAGGKKQTLVAVGGGRRGRHQEVKPAPPPQQKKEDGRKRRGSEAAKMVSPQRQPPAEQPAAAAAAAAVAAAPVAGQKLDPWKEKAARLRTLGSEYSAALETLRRTIPELQSLVQEVDTAVGAGQTEVLNTAGVFRIANTLLLESLKDGAVKPGYFEVHGLDWLDTVPDPMLMLMKSVNPLRQQVSKHAIAEGPKMKAWLTKRELAKRVSAPAAVVSGPKTNAKPAAGSAGVTPGAVAPQQATGPGTGRPPLPPNAPSSAGKRPQGNAAEVDGTIIRTTGSEMRDKAVRVLAHSMVTATSAVDAALEIEAVLFRRYCASTRLPNTEYYDKVRRIYEALSPRSPTCHPILRHMLLTGMLSPADMVTITAEELKRKEEEAKQELVQCRPGWLAEQLKNVQLPTKPQQPTPGTNGTTTTIAGPPGTNMNALMPPPPPLAPVLPAQAVLGAAGVPPGKIVSSGTAPLPTLGSGPGIGAVNMMPPPSTLPPSWPPVGPGPGAGFLGSGVSVAAGITGVPGVVPRRTPNEEDMDLS